MPGEQLLANIYAAGQLEAARQAVWASWAGAAANFAVVLVTCAIALFTLRDAERVRRESDRRAIRSALLKMETALATMETVFEGLEKEPLEKPALISTLRAIFAAARASAENAVAFDIPDTDVHRLAVKILTNVTGLQQTFEMADDVVSIPMANLVDSTSHVRLVLADNRKELDHLTKRHG